MKLSEAIKELYPNAIFDLDYRIVMRGAPSRIEDWNEPKLGPIPAEAQLAEGWRRVVFRRTTARLTESQLASVATRFPELGANPDPGKVALELVLDLAQSIKPVNMAQRLSDTASDRAKRNTKHAEAKGKYDSGSTAEQIEATKWEAP